MAFVEVRGVVALGREGAEGAHAALRDFDVPGLVKGSPDMGEGERSYCRLRKDSPPELDPG